MTDGDPQRQGVTKFRLIGRDTQDVSALVAIIRRLSIARSVAEIMDIVTHAARTMLAADGITFVLREGELCHYAEEDAISPLWKGKRFPMSACISGWCMNERKAVAIPDITQDRRIPQDAYLPTFVKSLAMVPVQQDDPIAAIGAYWSMIRTTSAEELALLQTVANSAALALAKVELERQTVRAQTARFELNHRLKNVLSVIDAMSRQTLRSTNSAEEFTEAFSGRLHALARAQTLLYEGGVVAAGLRQLIREQLMTQHAENRFLCEGPDVLLAADQAFDLGLLLHELGTNACKYGALSNDVGKVRITWNLRQENEREILNLVWMEEGGPPVTKPAAGGFGSSLLRLAFKKDDGETRVRYEPTGIICTMRIPLT